MCDKPLEHRSEVLSTLWHNVETTYIKTCKNVFRNQRDEREKIIKYYYNIRKDFLAYLRRPDHKQVVTVAFIVTAASNSVLPGASSIRALLTWPLRHPSKALF